MKIRSLKYVSARTKILLFAFLFITLPSGILGYLGFRSIGSRGLSLKENYRSMARLMRDEFEAELSNLEGRFVREILDQEWTQDVQADRLLLGRVQERHPAVGDAFIIHSDRSLIHPQFLLEAGAAGRAEPASAPALRDKLIEQGERYEFAELDYPEAVRSYEEAVRRAASPEFRSYARLLLGRCYFKMKDYSRAGDQYRILSEQSQGARSSDGTPLRIIGLYRLAETYASLGATDRRVTALLDLFEELSLGPGGFESREFYLESVRAGLDGIFRADAPGRSERERWDKLQLDDRARAEKIRFLEGVRLDLLSRLDLESSPNVRASAGPDSASSSHLTIRDEGGTPHRIGYLPSSLGAALSGRRTLGYELDETFVLAELFPSWIAQREAGESVRVGLVSEDKPLTPLPNVSATARALAVEPLSDYYPGWSLALFDSRGKAIDQIVRREMRLYAAVLFGIAALILSGILMTLRAATHEAEAVRLRSDFVSRVSHELKTPLSLIRLFGETLESDPGADDGKRREFSRIISRESRRLGHLIDNILDFSKIDSGRKEYRFETVDIVEVISDTIEAYRFYLRDRGFEFEVSLPPCPIIMSIDKDAIAQALLNLLDNAEKYSGERKYIGVMMVLRAADAVITVEDRGPGISRSETKRIFEKFYRGGRGPAREAQGCGLGLTIVKSTVESHCGHIRVESELGRGSRFIITLPLGGREDPERGSAEGDHGQNPDR